MIKNANLLLLWTHSFLVYIVQISHFLLFNNSIPSIPAPLNELILQSKFRIDTQTVGQFFRLTVDDVETFLLLLVNLKSIEWGRFHQVFPVIRKVRLHTVAVKTARLS